MKKMFLLLLTLHLCTYSFFSQTVDFSQEEIERQRVENNNVLIDRFGNKYGAGLSIDGEILRVVFYKIKWLKQKDSIEIRGTVYRHADKVDNELRLGGIKVFVANKRLDTLSKIKCLGYSNEDKKTEGDFHFKFKIFKELKLFFDGGNAFYLTVYDVWKLARQKKK